METTEIKAGEIVRHRHIMMGTDLYVVSISDEKLIVRYAANGLFQKQKLYLHEVVLFVPDEDEYH